MGVLKLSEREMREARGQRGSDCAHTAEVPWDVGCMAIRECTLWESQCCLFCVCRPNLGEGK